MLEVFLSRIHSYEDLSCIGRLLYRIGKHSLSLSCHQPHTAQAMHAAMRMGIGVTGYLEVTEEQRSWLPRL